MKSQKTTPFEAAARRARAEHPEALGGADGATLLVIDTAPVGAGVCTLSADGRTELLACTVPAGPLDLAAVWSERLAVLLGTSPAEALGVILDERANRRMPAYYLGSDGCAATLASGEGVPSSQIARAFDDVRASLDTALGRVPGLLDDACADEEDVRIVVCGRAARTASVLHAVRSALSGDPFLPDERFLELAPDDDADGPAGAAGIEVALLLLDEEGAAARVELAAANDPLPEAGNARFCEPFLASTGDGLTCLVDGRELVLDLPLDPGEAGAALVEAAAAQDAGKPALLVRPAGEPGKVRSISLAED